jgi:hypothetical protein
VAIEHDIGEQVSDPRSRPRIPLVLIVVALLLTAALYVFVLPVFRPDNVDDGWYLSYVYNYLHKGIAGDSVYAEGHDQGQWMGVRMFGKTQAVLCGSLLDKLGWTKLSAFGISSGLAALAALAWFAIMFRTFRNRRLAVIGAITLLATEPLFSVAGTARPDAFVFCFISLSLWAFVGGFGLLSGILAGIAIETHPTGLIAIFYVSAAWAAGLTTSNTNSTNRGMKMPALFAAGGLLTVPYYLLLHGEAIRQFTATMREGNTSSLFGDNMLFQYFCMTAYGRHIPEIFLFVVCAILFLRLKLADEYPFAGWLFCAAISALIFLHRPNFFYVVFVYPAFVFVALCVFGRKYLPVLWLLGLMMFLTPQYAWAWHRNHLRDHAAYVRTVQAAVPHDNLPVLGSANDWFAFPERRFYATDYKGDLHLLDLRAFYVVEDEALATGRFRAMRNFLDKECSVHVIKQFNADGRFYRVLFAEKPSIHWWN